MQNLELHNPPVIKENSFPIVSFILHLIFGIMMKNYKNDKILQTLEIDKQKHGEKKVLPIS
jgi:hypothetical protein